MKFNGNFLNPSLTITKEEREKIEIIKGELFTDLNHYKEIEKEELLFEIENFYTSSIQIELLERESLETKLHLAFNSYYYREKCFYVDCNGNAQITSNYPLFLTYVHGFRMLENLNNKGISIARNIIKVSLIEHLTTTIKNGNYHLLKKFDKKYLHLFQPWGFEFFQYLRNRYIQIESEETRYTLIFTFLKIKGIITGTGKANKYREMVRKETNIRIGFKNFGTNGKRTDDDFYEANEGVMTEILREFKEENNIKSKIGINEF